MKNLNVLATHFGDMGITPVNLGAPVGMPCPLRISTSYINNLRLPVTIGKRSGIKFTLPCTGNLTDNRLIMRVQYDINSYPVRDDFIRLLNTVDSNDLGELKTLRELITLRVYGDGKKVPGNTEPFATMILDYPITYEELLNYGSSAYYQEVDDVVSLLSWDEIPAHPYSEAGKNTALLEESDGDQGAFGFGYSVKLVDSRERYGRRFLNIGGRVYLIPTQVDVERRDGIYITANRPVVGGVDTPIREVKHYVFDEAESIGLYRTYEEALNAGDTSLVRKQQIAELEFEINLQKGELQRAKNEHEKEMMEKETRAKDRDAERAEHARILEQVRIEAEHRLRMEQAKTKAFYEERAYDRKDSNEILKFIPTIMVGIGSIIMAIKAFKATG